MTELWSFVTSPMSCSSLASVRVRSCSSSLTRSSTALPGISYPSPKAVMPRALTASSTDAGGRAPFAQRRPLKP